MRKLFGDNPPCLARSCSSLNDCWRWPTSIARGNLELTPVVAQQQFLVLQMLQANGKSKFTWVHFHEASEWVSPVELCYKVDIQTTVHTETVTTQRTIGQIIGDFRQSVASKCWATSCRLWGTVYMHRLRDLLARGIWYQHSGEDFLQYLIVKGPSLTFTFCFYTCQRIIIKNNLYKARLTVR